MNDNDNDGVALQSIAHPEDQSVSAALLKRVVRAMTSAAGFVDHMSVCKMAAAAINEVRLADFEFHEAMEARIEAATEEMEIELQGAFLSEVELAALREMLADGASVTPSSMAVLRQLKQRLGA